MLASHVLLQIVEPFGKVFTQRAFVRLFAPVDFFVQFLIILSGVSRLVLIRIFCLLIIVGGQMSVSILSLVH